LKGDNNIVKNLLNIKVYKSKNQGKWIHYLEYYW
jgi:hypothetical protein